MLPRGVVLWGHRPHGPRVSPRRTSKLVAKKGAHYNLRELQPLHEADMTATATTSRYAYLISFRRNVSYLQLACFSLKNGAMCASYDLILRSYDKVDRCWFGKMY